LTINPDDFAGSLAHVVKTEAGQEVLLGQAWVSGVCQLVTCGHVVDAFVSAPQQISVFFPLSGNRYPVNQIKMHPGFVRQPDQLVRFDAALLLVSLKAPDITAKPLPITYEKSLPVQMSLTAVRYPVHLGQFSSSMSPLAQAGSLLGPLRKNDNFHLLHDLALSPGDSGAAIFAPDGSVVGLHCGDTATLPGLNLPTTSIRLALWIDALRDLEVEGEIEPPAREPSEAMPLSLFKFALAFFLSFAIGAAFLLYPKVNALKVDAAKLKPVKLGYNKPRNGYKMGEQALITLLPGSDCNLYIFDEDLYSPGKPVYRAYPPGNTAFVKGGEMVSFKSIGSQKLLVNDKEDRLHLFAVSTNLQTVELGDSYTDNEANNIQFVDNRKILDELLKLKAEHPDEVIYSEMEGPLAVER